MDACDMTIRTIAVYTLLADISLQIGTLSTHSIGTLSTLLTPIRLQETCHKGHVHSTPYAQVRHFKHQNNIQNKKNELMYTGKSYKQHLMTRFEQPFHTASDTSLCNDCQHSRALQHFSLAGRPDADSFRMAMH